MINCSTLEEAASYYYYINTGSVYVHTNTWMYCILGEPMRATRNQLANIQNRYQEYTTYKRVLCVCSAGLLRSPTAAVVLNRAYGYNTRAAGCVPDMALVPLSEALIEWADEIVCMEPSHEAAVKAFMEECGKHPRKNIIKVLNVEDRFSYMDTSLQQEILYKYNQQEKQQ